jgi:hypothetical protein
MKIIDIFFFFSLQIWSMKLFLNFIWKNLYRTYQKVTFSYNFLHKVPTAGGFEPLKLRLEADCSTSALPQLAVCIPYLRWCLHRWENSTCCQCHEQWWLEEMGNFLFTIWRLYVDKVTRRFEEIKLPNFSKSSPKSLQAKKKKNAKTSTSNLELKVQIIYSKYFWNLKIAKRNIL